MPIFADCCQKAFAVDVKLHLRFPQSFCVPVLQGVMHLQTELERICSVAISCNLRPNIDKCVVKRFSACNGSNNLGCSYSRVGIKKKKKTPRKPTQKILVFESF